MNRPTLTATYRMQFHRDFPFAAAQALVPYLAELGISHLYASPIFAAVPGSRHGYDVTDPNRINPELGGEDGFERLHAELRRHGLGLILDIVPNHMAASPHNPYWMDVLEFGRAAPRPSCSTSIGTPIASTAGSCSRCSAMPCRRASRPARSRSRPTMRRAGCSPSPMARTATRSPPAALPRCSPQLRAKSPHWAMSPPPGPSLRTAILHPSAIAKARATLGVVLPSARETLAATLARRRPADYSGGPALAPRLVAHRRGRSQLSPLLQHHRSDRGAGRRPRGVRRDPCPRPRAGARRQGRRPARRSHRRADGPGALSGRSARRRRSRGADPRREDTGAARDAARLADRRHHRL